MHGAYTAWGRSSLSLPSRASAGKSFVQIAATPTMTTPPATTAGTAPTSEATAPDSNAPSSFDALMNTHSTALTLPCKDRKSTRLNSSHSQISYAVFCLKKKKKKNGYDNYSYL